MADTISNVGTGIAWQGQAKDYSGLIGQGLAMRQKRKKEEDEEFAKLSDFKVPNDLYAPFAKEVAKVQQQRVNEYFKTRQTLGKEEAAYQYRLSYPVAEAKISELIQRNKAADYYTFKKPADMNAPLQEQVGAVLLNPNATIQDLEALHNPMLGLNTKGTFYGKVYPKADYKTVYDEVKASGTPDPKSAKIIKTGYGNEHYTSVDIIPTDEAIDRGAMALASQEGAIMDIHTRTPKDVLARYPDLYSDDVTARTIAEREFFKNEKIKPNTIVKTTLTSHGNQFAPQGSASERAQEKSIGSQQTKDYPYGTKGAAIKGLNATTVDVPGISEGRITFDIVNGMNGLTGKREHGAITTNQTIDVAVMPVKGKLGVWAAIHVPKQKATVKADEVDTSKMTQEEKDKLLIESFLSPKQETSTTDPTYTIYVPYDEIKAKVSAFTKGAFNYYEAHPETRQFENRMRDLTADELKMWQTSPDAFKQKGTKGAKPKDDPLGLF